jgi:hypothetical protein
MKLIVSELGVLKGYVTREFFHVITDLVTNYGWRQIEPSRLCRGVGTVKGTLMREFGELPEVILFWETYDFLLYHAYDVIQLDCRKCFFADDIHAGYVDDPEGQEKLLSYSLCDTILGSYAYLLAKFYPRLSGARRMVWVPHSASPDFMLPYNDHPENAIFLSGCVDRHYPLRQRLKRLHEQQTYAIAYHPHPGYHCRHDYGTSGDVGRGYAARIHNYRVGFTDSLIFKYLVAKYFEIPATGALLLADGAVTRQLKELGLTENRHYLSVSSDDLEEKIRYVLDEKNRVELDEIRRRGQELVWERHKTSDRARLINEACAA